MIEYMGRRCAVCRERMYYGFVLGPPDRAVRHDVMTGVLIPGPRLRSAYHPACMPPDVRDRLQAYKAARIVVRNARRRTRRDAE